MFRNLFYVAISCVLLGLGNRLAGQSLPVGTPVLEDFYRRMQLAGKLDTAISFTSRPLNISALRLLDEEERNEVFSRGFAPKEDALNIFVMPAQMGFRYTSNYPAGWNDGAVIPAVGAQGYLSAGIYADYKFFSIQLMPEVVYAQNSSYRGFSGDTPESWAVWYEYANQIDMPEQFGNSAYRRILPGQSSIRFNYEQFSAGISTENLWWGPGQRNSLLMSNTAPGFLHFTINTSRPVETILGTFEGQLVAGRLRNSGFHPAINRQFDEFYIEKPNVARNFSGFVVSYQPVGLKGFTIGASRSIVRDDGRVDMPLFASAYQEDRINYKSVFSRWVMPKARFEVYAEYGRNNPGYDARDRFVQMDFSSGYIFGFKKLIPLRENQEEFIDVGLELGQVDQTRSSSIREAPGWYSHPIVRGGYTHLGQALGAGIGPGGRSQTLQVSWFRGLKNIGIQIERQERQVDFFYDAVILEGDFRRNWVDLSGRINGSLDYKRFIFHADLWFIKGLNYQYELEDVPNPVGADYWNFRRMDQFNFQASLGLLYRF